MSIKNIVAAFDYPFVYKKRRKQLFWGINLRVKTSREDVFFLILSENAIRFSAENLIAFENFLIVFSISQGENKICSIENKNSPFEEVLLF